MHKTTFQLTRSHATNDGNAPSQKKINYSKIARIFWATLLLFAASTNAVLPVDAAEWLPPESLDALPSIPELPDLFSFADGSPVQSADAWEHRRKEMKAILQYYQYGHLPPRPDTITVENLESGPIPGCEGTEQRMTLVLGSKTKLRMRIAVYVPPLDGRLPVIVREEAALGHLEEVPLLMKRGFMLVEYARQDLDPDQSGVVGPAQQAYPDYDWATLAVWAWGGMRVVDYLETRADVDLQRIGIVGHSRGGKMALLAGALDERFALTAANGSGCGGAGCYRIQSKKCETLAQITDPKRFAYWFHPRLRWFDGKEDRLPFDQHFLKALVAPRALICTEANDDLWANPLGTRATTLAAQKAFEFLEAKTKNAIHFREGKHDLTPEDWQAILDFADRHLRDKTPKNPKRFRPTPP